jgi:ubiquinol-cytochrome c reductase cytochrome c1 subunit
MSQPATMNLRALVLFAAVLAAPALHASEAVRLQTAPINAHDLASLQTGAKLFVNYCLNCHSAGYMRYNRLRDLGLTEQQIRDNLILTGVKVGEPMQVAMDRKEAQEWFGTTPPDLTVIARSRSSGAGSGSDWLYTYLRAFYRDESRPTGWNNLVFENVGMPHVLWQLGGQPGLAKQEFEKHDEAVAALLAAKTVARLDEAVGKDKSGKEAKRYVLKSLDPGKAGHLTAADYDKPVADLVNYMTYMAEPARIERKQIGIFVLFVLGILFVLALLLKKEYWKDVH